MARTYCYYCPVVHALEGDGNRLAQTLQISGKPERVEELLHTLGAREEKHSQLATPVGKLRGKQMAEQPYFISLNDETGQIFPPWAKTSWPSSRAFFQISS